MQSSSPTPNFLKIQGRTQNPVSPSKTLGENQSIHDHIAHSKNSSQQDHMFPTSTMALPDQLVDYPDFRSGTRTSTISHRNNFVRVSGVGVGGGVGGASLQIQGNKGNHL